ncbi:MAG: hypothetical protein AAF565_01765 [Pseudomonadota bacterium]
MGYVDPPEGVSFAMLRIVAIVSALVCSASLFSRLTVVRARHVALSLALVGGLVSVELLMGDGDTQNAERDYQADEIFHHWLPETYRCVEPRCVS